MEEMGGAAHHAVAAINEWGRRGQGAAAAASRAALHLGLWETTTDRVTFTVLPLAVNNLF
jgi:hypothetical protein